MYKMRFIKTCGLNLRKSGIYEFVSPIIFPYNVYKFKRISSQNIDTLLNNSLWVSNLFKMNDKEEFIYSFKKEYFNGINKRLFFQKSLYCISLSTTPYNDLLWKRYSKRYKGMALCYNRTDLVISIEKQGLTSFDNKVNYTNEKQDCKDFLNDLLNNRPSYNGGWLVFNKTLRWKKEKEYRFSVGSVEQEKVEPNNGFLLKNIKPKRIVLGEKFKRKGSIYDTILDYCLKNNIELCVMYKNNVMKVLYDKKGYYTNSYIPRVNIVKWIKDDGRKGH